jgi:1,2-phenylacetyl-CoA epoxidase catalytic subunit
MRLSVLHYPLEGWVDAVVMNVLMGKAVVIQLGELARVSYQPLAEAFRAILPRETRHAELGVEGLMRIAASEEGRRAAREAVAYWRPRVAASFGLAGSARYEMLARLGLRHAPNESLLAAWQAAVDPQLAALNLN